MASPFADFPNLRLAWRRPTGAPPDLREGIQAPTETVVIEASLGGEGLSRFAGGADPAGAPSLVTPGKREGKAYVIRWALLPTGQGWLDPGSSWSWDSSGLRPDGLAASHQELQAYFGSLEGLPAVAQSAVGTFTIHQVGGAYGDGGIGALLRAEIGDVLYGTLQLPL